MLILIAIFAYFLRDTGFMSPINLLSIVRVSTTITIMSIAIVFVLCAGEIDLSIAAIVPVSALITALCSRGTITLCSPRSPALCSGRGSAS